MKTNQVILCKESDSNKYEVWRKIVDGILDWEYIDTFMDVNEAIKYCEVNNLEIQTSYGQKEYK